jgi:hypothetical protein
MAFGKKQQMSSDEFKAALREPASASTTAESLMYLAGLPASRPCRASIRASSTATLSKAIWERRRDRAALRAAGIIIKLASQGELDPGRLQTAAMRWVTK